MALAMQHPRTRAAVVCAALLVAPLARGQGAPPAAAPSPASTASTAPSAPAPAGASKSPPDAAAPISAEAKRHFQAGVALLQDPEGERVEEAYREFKAAYEDSASPKILGNVGYCAMRLERDGEAIDAYSTYLRDVKDIAPDERAQITRDLQTLTVGVVRVSIEVDRPGATIQDVRVPVRGDRVTNEYGPVTTGKIELGVRPGHHVFTAKLEGYESATWEVEAYAGSREKHAFAMRPRAVATAPAPGPVLTPATGAGAGAAGADRRSGGPGIVPWVVAGAGGAMMIAGAVTGVVALGKTSDIEKSCPNDTCPRSFDLDGERSSARTFVRITDVLLIGGGALVAGGVAWAIIAGGGGGSKSAASGVGATARAAHGRGLAPDLSCGPTGCTGTIGGTF
jgi:hypothetical protein